MRVRSLTAAAFLALGQMTLAQTATGPNEGLQLALDSYNEVFTMSWWGRAGRTYFIQHSEDLTTWDYIPVIESGGDQPLQWGFSSNADRFFLRLRYTDIPTDDPFTADFDGDHVGNYDEVTLGTDPFKNVVDPDGLPQDWKLRFLTGLDSAPDADPDLDGLTNLQEYLYYSDPSDYGNWTVPPMGDSDNNGLADWWEFLHFGTLGNDPNLVVAGKDGLTLKEIYDHSLDMTVSSSAGDGIPDSWKVAHGLSTSNPNLANEDADWDGLVNSDEFDAGTDPQQWDSDGDWTSDGYDLHPLIPDPSTPQSVQVAVPSRDEQYNSPDPDYTLIDWTTVELRWEAASNNPTGYRIEKRIDNDVWQTLTTAGVGATTQADQNLVANRHYQYRITALKDVNGEHVESQPVVMDYEVPLNLRMSVKRSSLSRAKPGFIEFTNPSTPPRYFLKQTDTSSYSTINGWSGTNSGGSSSGNGSYSYTKEYIPAEKKWVYAGTYSTSSQFNNSYSYGNYSSSNSTDSNYDCSVQNRTRDTTTAVTQANRTADSQSNSTTPSSSSSSSYGNTGSYLFNRTFVPTDGTPRWMGNDYNLSEGSIAHSGNSSSSSYNTSSSGSSSSSSAQATVNPTGQWSGTSTHSGGSTTNISYAPYTSGWGYDGWFSGLQSTTPTERRYSSTSNSGDYYSHSSQGTKVLSEEFTTEAHIADVIHDLPDYPDEWDEDWYGWGYYDWGYYGWDAYWGYGGWWYGYGYDWNGWWVADRHLSSDERSFSLSKMTYKFHASPSASHTLKWYEIFIPDDDPATTEVDESLQIEIVRKRTWALSGSENESPEYEIDPLAEQPQRNGYYSIIIQPAHIGVEGIGEAGKDVSGQDTAPGKVVLTDDGDADDDSIPDYVDGYDLFPQIDEDDDSDGASFIPIYIGLYAVDPDNAKIKFTYTASDPKAVTSSASDPYILPASGRIRLWKKDASGGWDDNIGDWTSRNSDAIESGGDFVKSGVEYTLADLGVGYYYSSFALYAEFVKTSAAAADISVKVEIDPTGSLGYRWSDQLRFTAVNYHFEATGYQSSESFRVNHLVPSDITNFDAFFAQHGLTPGSFGQYRLAIADPRQTVTKATLNAVTLSLSRQDGLLKSPPFIALSPGSMSMPLPAGQSLIRIPVAGDHSNLNWNPPDTPRNKPRLKRLAGPENDLSQFVAEVSEEMKATNSQLTGAEFGRDFEARVTVKVKAVDDGRWLHSVRVHNDTDVIVSVDRNLTPNTAPPINNTTEIDFVRLKSRQQLKVGDIWDMSKVEFIHELKGSVSGTLTPNQYDRLKRLAQSPDKLIVHQPRWVNSATGWIEPPRFQRAGYIMKSLVIGGVAWGLYSMPGNASDALDKFEEAHENYKSTGGNFFWLGQMRFFRSQFLDAVVLEPASRFLIQIKERDDWVNDLDSYMNNSNN